jgi:hypothetical protein
MTVTEFRALAGQTVDLDYQGRRHNSVKIIAGLDSFPHGDLGRPLTGYGWFTGCCHYSPCLHSLDITRAKVAQ